MISLRVAPQLHENIFVWSCGATRLLDSIWFLQWFQQTSEQRLIDENENILNVKKGIPFVKSIATFTLWCNLSSWWFDKRRLFRKIMSIEHSWSLWQLKIEVWFVCNRDKKSFPQGVSCPFVVKNVDPGRTWTCNLRCRKPTPYPLGHRALAILHKICVSVMTQDFNTRPHSGKTYVVYLWLQEIHSNTTPSHDYLAQNLYFWFTCCMCWL